jgi:aryl-alcohol dehydrogenase-like predicted oxidoreductase
MKKGLQSGHATPKGTAKVAMRSGLAPDAFSTLDGVSLSSVGLGTYLGDASDATDALYMKAIAEALRNGINVLDTARNYRGGRSERVIGQALRLAIDTGLLTREQVFVSSKVGFVAVEGPAHGPWLSGVQREYVKPGIFEWGDLANGSHCLRPSFIEYEFELTRRAIGLETIDLYYLHDPETQLLSVTREAAMARIKGAFATLEKKCSARSLRYYGVATSLALRVPAKDRNAHLSLEALMAMAKEVGGSAHHFRAVQMPMSIGEPEALTDETQPVRGRLFSAIEAARRLGLYVFTSRSLNGGVLDYPEFPDPFFESTLNLVTDHQRALQFVRSLSDVGSALFGTTRRARVCEGAFLLKTAKLNENQLGLLISREPA